MLSDLILLDWDLGLIKPVAADFLYVFNARLDLVLNGGQVFSHLFLGIIHSVSHFVKLVSEGVFDLIGRGFHFFSSNFFHICDSGVHVSGHLSEELVLLVHFALHAFLLLRHLIVKFLVLGHHILFQTANSSLEILSKVVQLIMLDLGLNSSVFYVSCISLYFFEFPARCGVDFSLLAPNVL